MGAPSGSTSRPIDLDVGLVSRLAHNSTREDLPQQLDEPALRDAEVHKDLLFGSAPEWSVAPPNGTCEQEARRVAGGHAYSEGSLATGYFVPPTILELPSQARDAWREELFGPVLAVRRARTVDAAFGLASDSEFGLSAAIFTQDLTHTLDAIDDIDVGILHIDSNPPARTPTPLSAARRRADTLHAVTSICSLAVHVVEHANPRIAVLQGHIPDRSS